MGVNASKLRFPMPPALPRLVSVLAIAAAILGVVPGASAKSEEWKNAKGESFEAKPADILGPWALFDDSTLMPLSLLSDADCVRFYEGLKDKPARASDWKNATSTISSELYGRLLRYKGDSLVADDESGRPEPEFYIIFYVSDDKVQSWDELRRSTPALYATLEKEYPNRFQGVVYGLETESMQDYMDVAANTKGEDRKSTRLNSSH